MSDTPDEQRDHDPAIRWARSWHAERVLVNGLGIGMVVAALLHIDSVTHIDVVEIDPDVIALVGPHYEQMAAELGKTITIRQGDAYTVTWPADARWDIIWSDIWPDLCITNLTQMTRIKRKYGRRCRWHGCWSQDRLRYQRERERRRGW